VSKWYGCRTGHSEGGHARARRQGGSGAVRLRVWLPALADLRPDTPMSFEVLDGHRRVRNRGEAVAAGLPKGADCELVLDALDVLLVQVRLPKLNAARVAGALRGLVEEHVAGDVDRCHVAASAPDAEGFAAVGVLDPGLLRRGLEILQRAGQRVVQATPQPLALPLSPGNWRARVRDGRGSIRTGLLSGASFSTAAGVPVELRLLLAQASRRPAAIEVEGDCALHGWAESLTVDAVPATPEAIAPPVVLDLLQFEFAAGIVPWRTWRTTLALSAALLLVAIGGLNLHALVLRAQEKALRADMVRIVQEADPQVPVVLDPVAQMRRHVSDLRAGAGTDRDGFVALAATFAQIAGADTVQGLEYRSGQLAVRLRAPLGEADARRKALAEAAAAAGVQLTFSGDAVQLARKAGP
jgi:general secretion pathway protein L